MITLIILYFIFIHIAIFIVTQVFIYTDIKTAISGTFSKDGRLVEGCQCEVIALS